MAATRGGVPVSTRNPQSHLAQLGAFANRQAAGAINLGPDLTLRANETTTELVDARLSSTCAVLLDPTTANAAAAHAGTYALATDRTKGLWTFTHASAATTDRAFKTVILG